LRRFAASGAIRGALKIFIRAEMRIPVAKIRVKNTRV
jgi:hypothetical protein